ncbi:hypothetical protein SBADM41S_07664 [Streptomyces badius]
MSDTTAVKQQSTAAFYVQAVASFMVAIGAVAFGIFFLDADAWVRGFLAIGVLYLVTSCFTLAKVIRDRQEGRPDPQPGRPGPAGEDPRRARPLPEALTPGAIGRTTPKRLLRFGVWCSSC